MTDGLMERKNLFSRYGTCTPEAEYEQVYDVTTDTYSYLSVKELVDTVKQRIAEHEARMGVFQLARDLRRDNPMIPVTIKGGRKW